MELFGVGVPELGLIMLIALVVVGPQRFPEIARQMAHWIRTARAFTDAVMKDVRAAVDEIEQEVTTANDGVNPIRELKELRGELNAAARDAASTVNDATSTVADAAALPPMNDEWAAVTETRDTDTVIPEVPAVPTVPTEAPAIAEPLAGPHDGAHPDPEPAGATSMPEPPASGPRRAVG